MSQEAEDLKTVRTNVIAELLAGDIKPSYSIDGQSVDWNSYREHLVRMIEQLNRMIILFEPFEIRTQSV